MGLVVILAIGLSFLASAAPAAAAGNADLEKLIIPSPFVGWRPIPESKSQSFASYLNGVETAAIAPSGLTSISAAGGWEDTTTKKLLMIALVEINGNGQQTPSQVIQDLHPAAKAGAASFCSGAEAAAPASLTPVSGLPTAYLVVCPSTGLSAIPMGVSMTRANILAFLISTQESMSTQQLESIARDQYAALPKSSWSPASSAGGSTWVAFVGVGLFAIASVVVLVLVRRGKGRRGGSSVVGSPPGDRLGPPAAGWYADPNLAG